MENNLDFGFDSNEFLGELSSIPYAQFLNSDNDSFGVAITSTNAESTQFTLTDAWKPVEHEFSDGTNETLLLATQPKLLVLNRSRSMMSNETETIAYERKKHNTGDYKAFSYLVVWFLDDNNQPLSKQPFRLKCSGYSGLTFLRNYSYHNNPRSFCNQFLAIYKSLTGDRAIEKNELFYAHAVYQPTLVRARVTSSINGKSNTAVLTSGFLEPTPDNFASLIIKNGGEVSSKIKQFIQITKPWLQTQRADGGQLEFNSSFRAAKSNSDDHEQAVVSGNSNIDPNFTEEPLS